MRKIYICHNFNARTWLRDEVVPAIERAGHTVTSRWITDDSHTPEVTPEFRRPRRVAAELDLEDLKAADLVVFFAEDWEGKTGRGKWVELGYALAMLRDEKLPLRQIFVAIPDEQYSKKAQSPCVFLDLDNEPGFVKERQSAVIQAITISDEEFQRKVQAAQQMEQSRRIVVPTLN